MDTFDAIFQRRSVKYYDPNHEMSDDEIEKLLTAAIQSPTSFNIQQWRFVLVRDQSLREELKLAAANQAQITDASLLIVLTADLNAWGKEPERYWRNSPGHVSDMMVGYLEKVYASDAQLQRDEAHRSCGIAGQTIMLAAKAMGYDSCPMVGYDPIKVAELINLPEDHVISFIVVVGKATKTPPPKPGQLDLKEILIENRFA